MRIVFAFLLSLLAGVAHAQVTPGTSPLSGAKGGTNNAFMQFSGPASSLKTYTLPNASDTLAALGQIQTWTGAQSFSDGKLILLGSSSGSSTLKAAATGGGTATLFQGNDTIVGLTVAQALTNKTLNGNIFTTGTYTLTGVAGKTLTFNNSLTLAGTDGTTQTFQASDTIVGRATTDTLTNKTFDTAGAGNVFKINGTTISANTGTGNNVLATSPTLNQPNLVGTTTNDSAAAGSVGEYVSSVVTAPVTLTSGTAANITSISLTAGDWDVSGFVFFNGGATTTVTYINGSISTTSATIDTSADRNTIVFANGGTAVNLTTVNTVTGPSRFSLSTTTTVFLVARSVFGTSSGTAAGTIRARRIR